METRDSLVHYGSVLVYYCQSTASWSHFRNFDRPDNQIFPFYDQEPYPRNLLHPLDGSHGLLYRWGARGLWGHLSHSVHHYVSSICMVQFIALRQAHFRNNNSDFRLSCWSFCVCDNWHRTFWIRKNCLGTVLCPNVLDRDFHNSDDFNHRNPLYLHKMQKEKYTRIQRSFLLRFPGQHQGSDTSGVHNQIWVINNSQRRGNHFHDLNSCRNCPDLWVSDASCGLSRIGRERTKASRKENSYSFRSFI